jgi:NADPH-dependent ferric siderophore reductase
VTEPVIRRSPVLRGEVVAAGDVTPRMRRVTVRCEQLAGIEVRPAQDLELHLRDATGRRVKRRYTIRHHRPGTGEVDLDVALHGEGPGAAWGQDARPGDAVQFQGPRGKLEVRSAPWHLLVGDESALPAIATIAEALTEPAVAVIEIAAAEEEQPLPAHLEVHWVHRGGAPAGTPDLLGPVVSARLTQLRPGGRGYLLGETRTMVALRAALESHGFAHDSVFVKGYWNLGRPDRIAGRSPGSA